MSKRTYVDFGREGASVKKRYRVIIQQLNGRATSRSLTIRDRSGRTSIDSIKDKIAKRL